MQRLLTQIDYDTLNNSALKLYYGVFTGDGKANYPYTRSFNIGLRPKVVILTLNAEQNAFGGLTWMAGVDITTEAIQITNKGFKISIPSVSSYPFNMLNEQYFYVILY